MAYLEVDDDDDEESKLVFSCVELLRHREGTYFHLDLYYHMKVKCKCKFRLGPLVCSNSEFHF